jgi:hypothetical protein
MVENDRLISNHELSFRQRHSVIEQTLRILGRINEAFLDISQAFWTSVQVKTVFPSEIFPCPKILFAQQTRLRRGRNWIHRTLLSQCGHTPRAGLDAAKVTNRNQASVPWYVSAYPFAIYTELYRFLGWTWMDDSKPPFGDFAHFFISVSVCCVEVLFKFSIHKRYVDWS